MCNSIAKTHDSSEGVIWVHDTSCNLRDMGTVIFWRPQWSHGLSQYPPDFNMFSMERHGETETIREKGVSERREGTLGHQMPRNHHCLAWGGGN